MSLADLQKTIDESLANSNAFTRGLFEASPWDAQRVQEYANEDGSMTVATIGANGKPHTAIVIAGCVEGTLYFTASKRSAMLGNIRRDPDIAFTISDKINGRGVAQLAGRPEELKQVAQSFGNTMRGIIESGWDGYVYSVNPTRLYATASE